MRKAIVISLEVDDKVVAESWMKITSKTTIQSLLKKIKKFLEETSD